MEPCLADEVAVVVEVADSSGLVSVVAPMMAVGILSLLHTEASGGRLDEAGPERGQ